MSHDSKYHSSYLYSIYRYFVSRPHVTRLYTTRLVPLEIRREHFSTCTTSSVTQLQAAGCMDISLILHYFLLLRFLYLRGAMNLIKLN